MPSDINISTLHALNNLALHYTWFDTLVIFVANWLPFILAFAVAIFLMLRQHPLALFKTGIKWSKIFLGIRDVIFVALTSLSAFAVTYILKGIFAVPRPFLVFTDIHPLFITGGYDALPSNHATAAAALAFVVMRYDRRAGWFLIFGAIIISIARVISGVHYPLDIAVGFFVAYLVVWYIMKFFQPWLEKKGIVPNPKQVAILPKNL